MITKTKLVVTAASVALMLMTSGAFAKTFEAVYTVNIHKSATKGSHIVDKLFEGERVTVKTCDDNDWCLINHDGPDGWVPVASLERIGSSYGDSGPTIVIQGGFAFPHKPKPPIVVDPGPHKPPFGPIVGTLPTSVFDPDTGGGSGPVHPVHPVHPIGPIVNGGNSGPSSICAVKPQFCQPGGNSPGGHSIGTVSGVHF